MRILQNKLKIKNKIPLIKKNAYIIFFCLMTVYWYCTYILTKIEFVATFKNIVLFTGVIFYIIGFIGAKHEKKELIIETIGLGFMCIVYLMSGCEDEGIITIIPTIFAVKDINFKKITKAMFWTLIICSTILCILSMIKVIPYQIIEKKDAFGNVYKMFELAQQHGNPHSIVVFNQLTLYLYTYWENINIKKSICMQLLIIISFFLFYSRTGVILATISIWGALFIKKEQEKKSFHFNNYMKNILKCSHVIFYFMVYFIGIFLKNTKLFDLLNKVVSSRIMEVNIYLSDFGVALLPRIIPIDNYICDNFQVKMLTCYGLIFTIIYLYLSVKTIEILIKKEMYKEVFFLILFLLYSYCEVVFFKPFSNFSMLFFIYVFLGGKNENSNNKVISK